jgi:hypothetical protein
MGARLKVKPQGDRAAAVGGYEKPTVVDYGSLVDLTAANEPHGKEDGLGKSRGRESHPM